jgi:hypothetical protein
MKFIAAVCAATAISTVGVPAQVQRDITTVGCVRAWRPATADVTRQPENREPGMASVYVLTPLVSDPTMTVLPTYLLTPTTIVNFQQHLDRKVEVIGAPEAAPVLQTVQGIAGVPALRENTPNPQTLPRLTVKSLKLLADACPS